LVLLKREERLVGQRLKAKSHQLQVRILQDEQLISRQVDRKIGGNRYDSKTENGGLRERSNVETAG
jgi:hypothetical protein